MALSTASLVRCLWLSQVLGHQVLAADLDQLPIREDAQGFVELCQESGGCGLSGAGIADEDEMLRYRGDLHALLASA